MAETPNVLTPLQRDFLSAFFARSIAEPFFLTGGTALAAFYLHHRYSEDLDLFTLDHDALDVMEREIPILAAKDFVDLYFLLQQGFDLDELMQKAKEKDLRFTEFYFAGSLGEIRRVHELPRMIKPVTLEQLYAFYNPLATQILLNIKPRD
jgi:predicted nucleotidyltransferase component of viral defense system